MLASTHRLSRGAVRAFGILLAGAMLAGCGINTIPTLQEQAKAAWSEVLNQYQRRSDLVPNLVETVRGYAKQEQDTLKSLAKGLDLVVDYGIFTVIAAPLFVLLKWLHSLVHNWGWAIVLLTIIIKSVFYPLNHASARSMAKMKVIAPKLKALARNNKVALTIDDNSFHELRSAPSTDRTTFPVFCSVSTYLVASITSSSG